MVLSGGGFSAWTCKRANTDATEPKKKRRIAKARQETLERNHICSSPSRPGHADSVIRPPEMLGNPFQVLARTSGVQRFRAPKLRDPPGHGVLASGSEASHSHRDDVKGFEFSDGHEALQSAR